MRAALKAVGLFLGGVPQWVWIVAAVGAAALWIDHRGYARAEADAKQARLERIIDNGMFVLQLDRELKAGLEDLERQTADKFATIQKRDQTVVQPIIQREFARDPLLATRECLTPELVRAINISRGGNAGSTGQADDQRASKARVPGSAAAR